MHVYVHARLQQVDVLHDDVCACVCVHARVEQGEVVCMSGCRLVYVQARLKKVGVGRVGVDVNVTVNNRPSREGGH